MGLYHSTPIPNPDEFDYYPKDKSMLVSLSDEMKCCEQPGQFYGITLHHDTKNKNDMKLTPMTEAMTHFGKRPTQSGMLSSMIIHDNHIDNNNNNNTTTTDINNTNTATATAATATTAIRSSTLISNQPLPTQSTQPTPPIRTSSLGLPPPPLLLFSETSDHGHTTTSSINNNNINTNHSTNHESEDEYDEDDDGENHDTSFHHMVDDDDDFIDDDDNNNPNALLSQYEGWRMTGTMDALGGRLMLRGSRNQLVALVVRQRVGKGYLILGREPMYEGQFPHPKLRLDGKFLYIWARVSRTSQEEKYQRQLRSTTTTTTTASTKQQQQPQTSETLNTNTPQNDDNENYKEVEEEEEEDNLSSLPQQPPPRTTFRRRLSRRPSFLTPKLKGRFLQWTIRREDAPDCSYVADYCGPMFGTRMVRVSDETTGKPCAFIRHYFPHGIITDSRWDLLVGPGVCPCIMVCFVSILNEGMARAS